MGTNSLGWLIAVGGGIKCKQFPDCPMNTYVYANLPFDTDGVLLTAVHWMCVCFSLHLLPSYWSTDPLVHAFIWRSVPLGRFVLRFGSISCCCSQIVLCWYQSSVSAVCWLCAWSSSSNQIGSECHPKLVTKSHLPFFFSDVFCICCWCWLVSLWRR